MKAVFIVWMATLFFVSCGSGKTKQVQTVAAIGTIASKTGSDTTIVRVKNGIPIFYNMYLSVELSSLFKSIDASYNEKILNSPDKVSRYNSSVDKALNLGVYAVDLSYAKYFNEYNQAGKYLKTMRQLSTELGIPDGKFMLSMKRVENNVAYKDSMIKIANEVYKATEQHLKENERGSAAALIIAGGWTEAMYIAINLISKPEEKKMELLERFEEQKYSLQNLIDLLTKYKKEIAVKEFLLKLFDLKTSFDKFKVMKNETGNQLFQEISLKIMSLRKDVVN